MDLQLEKKEEKKLRDKFQTELEETNEKLIKEEEAKVIALETKRLEIQKKLEAAGPKPEKKLSKRVQKRLDKIDADKNKTDLEKQLARDELLGSMEEIEVKKRARLDGIKDYSSFITAKRATVNDGEGGILNPKANQSSLWNDNEKSFLENVTMDLIPDDDAMNTKGKTVRKWDKVKKRYVLTKIDREGKVMREKKNESGKKITKKNAEKKAQSIYKSWQSKTHLSLQRAGEQENKKLVQSARLASEGRSMMKSFSSRHTDLMKGEDVRNPKHLIKAKGKQMEARMERSKSEGDKNGKYEKFSGRKQYSKRVNDKIKSGMKPTRSKMIIRGKGGAGGGNGQQKRSKSGRGKR